MLLIRPHHLNTGKNDIKDQFLRPALMKLALQCLLMPVGGALESRSQGANGQGSLSKETVS